MADKVTFLHAPRVGAEIACEHAQRQAAQGIATGAELLPLEIVA